MKIGETVRLADSRGCWTLHKVTEHDTLVDGVFVRFGQAWKNIVFHDCGRDDAGMSVFVSDRPVLEGKPFNPRLHVPEGWHVPTETQP